MTKAANFFGNGAEKIAKNLSKYKNSR